MIKYIGNKKYVSCDELARIFTKDYDVNVSMEDIHRLVDSYCRKQKGSLIQINGEWFYNWQTIWSLRCVGDKAVDFVDKIKALKPQETVEKMGEDDYPLDPFFDKKSVNKWYKRNEMRKINLKLTEGQFKRLFENTEDEGVEWSVKNGVPNLHINTSQRDADNAGKMSVDTRVFGNRSNILYGDGTRRSNAKNLQKNKFSKDAALTTYLNLIDYIKNGHKGQIFTDKNVDNNTVTAIKKMLKINTDEEILLKAKGAIERIRNSSQIFNNLYDRVNSYTINGKDSMIPKYNLLQVPYTNVKCIALFSMTDFNFSDAIKHGELRQNGNTDNLIGIKKKERKSEGGLLKNIPITYDNGVKPNVAQNFSLNGIDMNNNDHYKQNYQYQGGKYDTNVFGYDDLERELRKPKNYTSINQFMDKSIIYAYFALKEEDFIPDYIITVPSSSKYNHYYAINLSNKIGCKYIQDFFRKNLINVKFNGEDVYTVMRNNGCSEKEILDFETSVKNIAYYEIATEIEKEINKYMLPYKEILSNISISKNSREKASFKDVMTCIYKYAYQSLTMDKIFSNEITRHLINNFIEQKVDYKDKHLFNSIVSLITLKIGKKYFNEMLVKIIPIIEMYTNMLSERGYKLSFGTKKFKVTNFDKKYRPYLTNVYVVADGFVNQETKMLIQSLQHAKVLIFDEDINTGTSLKLCIDAYKEKMPNSNTKNLICLTNAYSDSGR